MADPGYDNQFQTSPDDQNYRPSTNTDTPKIYGIQTAVVTAEEFEDGTRPEINANEYGCVRLRFQWDQRDDTNDSSATSHWVRVSQYWAGAGYGAQYTPRVGHEVLVAFIDGDPEQPVIVGRVYNSKNRPPIDPSGDDKTKSTIKSDSTTNVDPEGDAQAHARGFNEIQFVDTYQKEEINVRAQRNLNELILANHSTSVGGEQTLDVGGNQTNSIHKSQSTTVGGNQTFDIGGHQTTTIHKSQTVTVLTDQIITVDGLRHKDVDGTETNIIGGDRKTTVTSGGNWLSVAGNCMTLAGGLYSVQAPSAVFKTKSFLVEAGSAKLSMMSGYILLDNGAGARIALLGSTIFVSGGAVVTNSTGDTHIHADANINESATLIKLNG